MMGTGAFAYPAFQELIQSTHQVVGLVTQPDRVGAGHHQHVNPLKELAIAHQIPVFQPEKANAPESLQRLRDFQADIFVVAAYGQILSADLLGIPRLGAINLHGSLLPKYRGAAPIQYSVWKGEVETGITVFQIEPKLDAGPILGVVKTQIGPKETSGELHDRMAQLAAPLTIEVLSDIESGNVKQLSQDTALVTKSPKIRKDEGNIQWDLTSQEIGWHVRAMQPWPMPFTFLHLPDRKPIRLLVLDVDPCENSKLLASSPGTVAAFNNELHVRTGDGVVKINSLQPSGKRAMNADDFLRGTPVSAGRFERE
ncbi:methionyl-tRNA formyltransferase [Planctomicrobium sp. SH668]|uniref:methionyl-tRNA formyltransferase n=1 Tax=Planctomicrobium sp. SH668 TaxID=3448126 RepID=UPI003F5C44D2